MQDCINLIIHNDKQKDTGLACYLLGIESETRLSSDCMRGHLFENMVVADIVKHRAIVYCGTQERRGSPVEVLNYASLLNKD